MFDAVPTFTDSNTFWQYSNCSKTDPKMGEDFRTSGADGALFCNGLEPIDSACGQYINYDSAGESLAK